MRSTSPASTYDISRAHFYGVAQRRLIVELLGEECVGDSEPMVGLLKRKMYGTVDASAVWQMDYAARVLKAGFVQGRGNFALFWHEERKIRLLAHVDDFAVPMPKRQRDWFEKLLAQRGYKATGRLVNPGGLQETFYVPPPGAPLGPIYLSS